MRVYYVCAYCCTLRARITYTLEQQYARSRITIHSKQLYYKQEVLLAIRLCVLQYSGMHTTSQEQFEYQLVVYYYLRVYVRLITQLVSTLVHTQNTSYAQYAYFSLVVGDRSMHIMHTVVHLLLASSKGIYSIEYAYCSKIIII